MVFALLARPHITRRPMVKPNAHTRLFAKSSWPPKHPAALVSMPSRPPRSPSTIRHSIIPSFPRSFSTCDFTRFCYMISGRPPSRLLMICPLAKSSASYMLIGTPPRRFYMLRSSNKPVSQTFIAAPNHSALATTLVFAFFRLLAARSNQ